MEDEGKTQHRPSLKDMEEEFAKLEDCMADMLPSRFVTHMRAAQKEMILAMRSLLDGKLEHIEAREKRRAAAAKPAEAAGPEHTAD
jgi:hypothetical protein